MRGMLSFLILFLISKKEMSGQEITKELEKRRGEKPSPGTVYPALKQLREQELIKENRKGKEINYTLTKKGKEGLIHAKKHFLRCFKELF